MFNLCHASAWNVIEQIFGVLKRRFCILLISPEYKIGIQARIPTALCALHNYIRAHDPQEGHLPQTADLHDNPTHQGQPTDQALTDDVSGHAVVGDANAHAFCNRIVMQMWEDYEDYLCQQDLLDVDQFLEMDEEELETSDDDDEQDVGYESENNNDS